MQTYKIYTLDPKNPERIDEIRVHIWANWWERIWLDARAFPSWIKCVKNRNEASWFYRSRYPHYTLYVKRGYKKMWEWPW